MRTFLYNPFYWLRYVGALLYFVLAALVNIAAFLLTLFNTRAVCRLMRCEAVGLLALLGVKVVVTENRFRPLPRGHRTNFLFIANHQSMLDILVVFSLVPEPLSFIAKKELFWVPFLNVSLWTAGCISIDRHSLKRSYRDIQKAVDVLKRKRSLIIFPEGTRQLEDAIGPFKPGYLKLAREAGVDLVPIVMSGSGKVMNKKSLLIDPRKKIYVSFGEPLPLRALSPDHGSDEVRLNFVRIHESMKGNREQTG